MKIPYSFPIIKNYNMLIIVSGGISRCIFYHTKHKKIKKVGEIDLSSENFSDREGHFRHQTQNKLLASGGGYKDNLYNIRKKKFFSAIKNQLISFSENYTKVYLFAPKRHLKVIQSLMPSHILKPLEHIFTGNFTKHHILKLLFMIKKQRMQLPQPTRTRRKF